jgi:hypothetical protein
MLATGDEIDRYRVEGVLGVGGMAAVYRVRHLVLDRPAALKVLHVPSKSIRERLTLEGKIQARLVHPNVVAVTDVIDVAGAPGLVMEYVDGPSLDRWLDVHRPTDAQIDALARGILRGAMAAHAAGTIHRDLKPGNVLLAVRDGELVPKITDFGLGKVLANAEGPSGGAATRSGMSMGTPAYMAPEQHSTAKEADERADVFSLGCLLYELLSGVRAFPGEDFVDLLVAVRDGRFQPLAERVPTAPPRWIAAIEAALRPSLDERTPTVAALYEAWTGELAATARATPNPDAWDPAVLAQVSALSSGADLPKLSGAAAAPPTMAGPPSLPEVPAPAAVPPAVPARAAPLRADPRPQAPVSVVVTRQAEDDAVASFPPPDAPRAGWRRALWMAVATLAMVTGALLVGVVGVGVGLLAAPGLSGGDARVAAGPAADAAAPAAGSAPAAAPADGASAEAVASAPVTPARPAPAGASAPVVARGAAPAVAPPVGADASGPAAVDPAAPPAAAVDVAAPAAVEAPPPPAATGVVHVTVCSVWTSQSSLCVPARASARPVRLLDPSGQEVAPGALPVGRYTVRLQFEGEVEKTALAVELGAGDVARIRCARRWVEGASLRMNHCRQE